MPSDRGYSHSKRANDPVLPGVSSEDDRGHMPELVIAFA
jgi:hypothetical protein